MATPSQEIKLRVVSSNGALECVRRLGERWRERARECREKAPRQPHDVKRQETRAKQWEQAELELDLAFTGLICEERSVREEAAKTERRRVLDELEAKLAPKHSSYNSPLGVSVAEFRELLAGMREGT